MGLVKDLVPFNFKACKNAYEEERRLYEQTKNFSEKDLLLEENQKIISNRFKMGIKANLLAIYNMTCVAGTGFGLTYLCIKPQIDALFQ